ncbi:glycosyltransferase [Chloroflexota bacterium]
MGGFKNSTGEIVGVMDTKLQHPPEIIPELIKAVENGADIAVASRYIPEGGVESWSLPRRIVSKGAVILSKPLTQVKDPMSVYFMLTREVISIVKDHGLRDELSRNALRWASNYNWDKTADEFMRILTERAERGQKHTASPGT